MVLLFAKIFNLEQCVSLHKLKIRVDLYLGFSMTLLWIYSFKILIKAIVQLKIEGLRGTS